MALHVRYFLNESFRAFRKAKWMTLATVATIGITLFLISCFLVLFWYIHIWISRGEAKMEMVTFITEEYVSQDSAKVICRQIESIAGVEKAGWVSKDSAMQIFQRLYGSEMLDAVDENPLPASFHIILEPSYRQSDSLRVLQNRFYAISGIEEVGYGKEWFPILEKIRSIFVVIAIGIGVITLFTLYWMVANTIRFTLFARRNVIEIMQMVGATDTFIKIPFYLEGFLQGFLGSCLAIFLLYFGYQILSPRVPELYILGEHAYLFLFLIVAAGIIMATWCSKSALRKYLA